MPKAKSQHVPVQNGECLSCHNPHASTNKFLVKLTGKAFLNGTAMQASAKGKTLTKKGAIAGRAVLYVDKGKGFGTINVLYNGKVVKKISLASTKALTKVAIALPKVTKTTTIVIKTTSAKKVQIDGLLLARI